MKRYGRIMIVLVLVLVVAIACAASLFLWNRFNTRGDAPEAAADTTEDFGEETDSPETSEFFASDLREDPIEEPKVWTIGTPEEESIEEPETEPTETPIEEAEKNETVAPMVTPCFVSLYNVEEFNSRPRASTAVKTETVAASPEMRFTMEMYEDLTYLDTQLGDIPLLEVYRDDGTVRPLLLFMHGLGDDKESLITALAAFADAGYHAVGVDAFDQGDRCEDFSYVDTWAAVLITVADIEPIIEYYQTMENVTVDGLVMGGFSMGAVEAMAYVETGSYNPAALIALCGICESSAWQLWQQFNLTYGWMKPWDNSVLNFPEWQTLLYTDEKYDAILATDVSYNLDSFVDIPILCCIGTEDLFFDAKRVQNVMQQIEKSGNENTECIVYPFGVHEISNRMLTDSLQFLSRTGVLIDE